MGSLSGLKSILLLFDLCTCRISDQNQNLNDLLKEIFGFFLKYNINLRFMVLIAMD